MKIKHRFQAILALAILVVVLLPAGALASAKRRIAVLPFEYGAVTSSVGTVDVGKGITTLLVTRLVNDGTYSVIERQMLDSILKEQNLSVSDRADPTTAAKIGRLLSVDAIVVGTVTQFGFEDKSFNIGAAASAASRWVPYAGGFGFGGAKIKKGKVKVAVDARVVDINTGEILSAVNGAGESKRSGADLWGGGGSGWSGGSGSFGFGSSDFASTIAGEATLAAVDSIATQLVALAFRIPDNQLLAVKNVKGVIADVTGDQVVVNVGKANGLNSGDSLQVERIYKTVKDPMSGRVLKELSATIAVVTLSEVDSGSSTGKIVRGGGLKVGDAVRKVETEVSAVLLDKVPGSQESAAAGDASATVKTGK